MTPAHQPLRFWSSGGSIIARGPIHMTVEDAHAISLIFADELLVYRTAGKTEHALGVAELLEQLNAAIDQAEAWNRAAQPKGKAA